MIGGMSALAIRGNWGRAGGGVRPSTVLVVGALLMAAGSILGTETVAAVLGNTTNLSWLSWGLGLTVTGWAFMINAPRLWTTTMMAVVGIIFLLQAVSLALALLTNLPYVALIYSTISLPKWVSLAVLSFSERRFQRPWRRIVLLTTATGGTAKVAARTISPDTTLPPYVEIGVVAALTVALVVLAGGLRKRENDWADRRMNVNGGIEIGAEQF